MPESELAPFVRALATRIASYSPEAVARAKRAVLLSERGVLDDLREEERLFFESARSAEAKARMAAYLDAGGQNRDVELSLDQIGKL
jgi:enoyl-CoA hydratase/carnithine racemase